jgi:hypothetical protein
VVVLCACAISTLRPGLDLARLVPTWPWRARTTPDGSAERAVAPASAPWWRRGRGAHADAAAEPAIPLNFLRAESTPERARARWAKTLEWRASERIDAILSEPNPVFYALKAHYPHCLHLPDKHGHLT